MALLGFEGFDGINSDVDLILGPFTSRIGSAVPLIDTDHARTGSGKCVSLIGAASTGVQLLRGLGTSVSTVIGGAAMIVNTAKMFMGLYNGTTCQVSFSCDSNGIMQVYRGLPSTGTLLATAAPIVRASVYNYFELRATIGAGTSGSLTARVNNGTVFNLSSINTSADGTTAITQVGIGTTHTSGTSGGYFDDCYVADSTGSAPYNTFLGDVHVTTLLPTANSSVTFTPHASSNYDQVSEVSMDSDTTYNVGTAAGQVDLFTTEDLPTTPSTIHAVQVKMAAKIDGAGSNQIAGVVKSSSVQSVGTGQSVLSDYAYFNSIFTVDPNTSTAWTKATVDAATFGYKRVS